MRRVIPILLLLPSAAASPPVSNSTPEALSAIARDAGNTVTRLTQSIGELIRDKSKLEQSSAARSQRRELLLRQYNGLSIRAPATYQTLHEDLDAFQKQQIELAAQLYGLAGQGYAEQACESLSRFHAEAAGILASELAQKRLEDGSTVGEIVRRAQQNLHENLSCPRSQPGAPNTGTQP